MGIHSRHPALRTPSLLRIAPQTANAAQIIFMPSFLEPTFTGKFSTHLHVTCPDFQTLLVAVEAHIGAPLLFPISPNVLIRPCLVGRKEVVELPLANVSHYPLRVSLTVLEEIGDTSNSTPIFHITTSSIAQPVENDDKVTQGDALASILILPNKITSVRVHFCAPSRGPYTGQIILNVQSPLSVNIQNCCINAQPLHVFGIAMGPNEADQENANNNFLEWLRHWISSRVPSPIPLPSELASIFEKRTQNPALVGDSISATAIPPILTDALQISFKSDMQTVRPSINAKPALSNTRRPPTITQTIQIQNRGPRYENVTFLASFGFSVEPRSKRLLPNDFGSVEVVFTPQEGNELAMQFGFLMAVIDESMDFCTTQLIGFLSGILND